ncbi:MAG: choice-of-anchor Q domain-containing protein [Anaerolineae bacterium]
MNLSMFNRSNFRNLIFTGLFVLAIAPGFFSDISIAEADTSYFYANSTADLGDINPGDGICQASNWQCTLRAAIEENNALPELHHEIHLPAGNYLLNNQLVLEESVSIFGAGKGVTIIDGQGITEILHVKTQQGTSHLTVHLRDLTIQNGQTTTAGGDSSGLHIDSGARVYLYDLVVQSNVSSEFGGGIQNHGILQIYNSEILNNSLPFTGDSSTGGGIFNNGQLKLMHSLLAQNEAMHGGGIANTNEGLVRISNSTVSHNTSITGGGGIRNIDHGQVHINHSTITQNTVNGSDSEEGVNRFGGGIYNEGEASIRLGNSILAGNHDGRISTDPEFSPDCFNATIGKFSSRGHNIIGINSASCYINGLPTDQNGSGLTPLDPMLDSLANRVHMPLKGSPAIDKGLTAPFSPSSQLIQSYYCVSLDQNFQKRAIDGDLNGESRCDIGAAEYVPDEYYEIVEAGFIGEKIGSLIASFGSVQLGDISKKQLEIINNGEIPVEVKDLELPDGFETADRFESFTLEPGEQGMLTILFNPADYGTYEEEMSLVIGESRFQWTLVGEATKPDGR